MNMKKILFVASECHPFASSGGLGDVIGSLPEALKKEYGEKADVRVVIPLYTKTEKKHTSRMKKLGEIYVPLSWRNQYCGIFSLEKKGVTYYFLDNEYYFNRPSFYGSYDDGERFAFFSKAALEILPHIGFFPDILHAHDWQSALSVVYLKRKYAAKEGYSGIKAVFTIHNIAYQGVYGTGILEDILGLTPDEGRVMEYNGDLNLMKGAIVCADSVSTVSPTYAKEILSPRFSHGLHYALEQNSGKITGILNGIDRNYYNPGKDREIPFNYTFKNPALKAQNKAYLQNLLGLPAKPKTLLFAVVSRLADHKGLDLLALAADDILRGDVQLAVLGKGDYYYENFFTRLSEKYPDKVASVIAFDKDLSKKIYAGGDALIMPSQSEPCGLAQMIACRYGMVPVVRETGGLYDSIKDVGWEGGGNGFTFAPYSAWELFNAADRAKEYYRDGEKWDCLVKTVMKWDFSWKKSAREYIKRLYG
ncbi:MAG: glycogen/starch synthase [Eubacteriales bacterium]